MNGNDLLWAEGKPLGGLDISLAYEDLELNRLCMLLFPSLGTERALSFAESLLTDDGETIRMRQAAIRELLARPALAAVLEKLLQAMNDMETAYRGLSDNPVGQRVTRMDAAMDSVKKAVIRLERNISQQAADIREENAADNRYAQLLRYTLFRKRLAARYTEEMSLLQDELKREPCSSPPLQALSRWVEECAARDHIEQTAEVLRRLDGEWKGVGAFAIDVCLDSRRIVVGLEVAEIRSESYAHRGMLEGTGTSDSKDGITSLINFPQNGSGTLFQEYLLSQVGYEVRGQLTKLRDALVKLPLNGVEELLSLRDALLYYTGAVGFCRKLQEKGSAICAPSISETMTFRFAAARLPEQSCTGILPVPNDLALEPGGCILMTGPNSSGKTCCLIMAGQLLFLGQLGCLIPAEAGEFSPRDRLLTLFAAGESKTGEDSRMGMEVQRIRLLRTLMTSRSILLFNEPMTSTSAAEGAQICTDLLTDLARQGVPSILVTHFNHIWPGLEGIMEDCGFLATLTCDFGVNRLSRDPDCLRRMKRICRSHGADLEKLLSQAEATLG